MKLLIIRHGEPNKPKTDLTEKGKREAELLKDRLLQANIGYFYTSPLQRAISTAMPTLQALNKDYEVLDWLREFDATAVNPKTGENTYAWDRLPSFLKEEPAYFDASRWADTAYGKSGDLQEKYNEVCTGLDSLLLRHGYRHNGIYFDVERENRDTVALFCHYGVECVILSHLLNISPMVLWHGFVALPSSVTVLATEEREKGLAQFRCSAFGDLSHLYAGNEPASFHARFCENYSCEEERH